VRLRGRWRSGRARPLRPDALRWSPDGRTLAAVGASAVRVLDGETGRLLRTIATGRRDHFQAATFLRGPGARLVLVRHDFSRGRSRVSVVAARRPGARERTLLGGRGSVVDVTPSPDGRAVLLGRRTADEWRILPVSPGVRPLRIHGVTRHLNPSADGRWAFPAVRAWRP
jgi:hypothetical protein